MNRVLDSETVCCDLTVWVFFSQLTVEELGLKKKARIHYPFDKKGLVMTLLNDQFSEVDRIKSFKCFTK